MTYKHSKSCILTNGFLSKNVSVTRSVKQGCPLSPMLYIIQAGPLACTIRNDKKIKGIDLPEMGKLQHQAKISMFADDSQIFVGKEKSIQIFFEILKQYGKASGAKINLKKTKGMYSGSWKQTTKQ